MIQDILNKLGLGEEMDTSLESRRHHLRRRGIHADVIVGNQTYCIRDWSLGGIFFETQPDPRLTQGDTVELTVQFRLPHETVRFENKARVVRATRRGIATAFDDMKPEARKMMQRVIDGVNAAAFADSQVA
jgi:hypothetical protein